MKGVFMARDKIPVVFGDVVQVFTADDQSTGHLGRDNTASKDTATDAERKRKGQKLQSKRPFSSF